MPYFMVIPGLIIWPNSLHMVSPCLEKILVNVVYASSREPSVKKFQLWLLSWCLNASKFVILCIHTFEFHNEMLL